MPKRSDRKDDLRRAWAMTTSEPWPFEPEFQFEPARRWRFDWSCYRLKLAIEVEGVTRFGKHLGGHQSAKGYAENCDKYNRAVEVGWTMLRYTPEQIKAKPVQIVEQILATIARLERERSRKAA